MKIWIVDYNNHSFYYTFSQCNALVARSNEVLLITSSDYVAPKPNYMFSVWKPYGKLSSKLIKRFSKLSKRKWFRSLLKGMELPFSHCSFFLKAVHKKPDVLHFHWLMVPLFDLFLLLLLRLMKIRISITIHDILPHKNPMFHATIYHFIYNLAHHLFVHSEKLRQEANEKLRLKSTKIFVIKHGNFDDFANQQNFSEEYARSQLEIRDNIPVILFFGLLREYKGLKLLIDCYPKILKEFPKAFLIIAGKETYKGYFESYKKQINKLNLQTNIKLILRFIDLFEMDLVFLAADVVVLPYKKSYQSGVIFNAISYGKPVVATNTGSFKETIDEHNLGIIVNSRTPDNFADGIIKQLRHKNDSEFFARHAKHISANVYSWLDIADRMLQIYLSAR